MWKRDPVTGTISGKLFSLLSFRAGWEADRLRACASSRLTSFIGREAEGRVRLFTTDALSEKQENTFQLGVRIDESKSFMSLFDWNISCGGWKGAARAGREAFCQMCLTFPQQPYPSECIPSRGHAPQPKAAIAQACCLCCRRFGVKEASLKATGIHAFPFSLPSFPPSFPPSPDFGAVQSPIQT